MKTYFCFSTRHIIYVRFPWRCKIPFLFQDALLSPPPNVDQHLRQHFFLQKLYQLHCDLSANIRWCGDRINIIIHFMFHGNLEECSEKCLFRLGLDSGWAAAATEREGAGKPSPSFPQCWGKKYIPGLTSDPGLVLIYFSKLSSPPRSKYRGEIEVYTGIPREFKENDLWDRISVATNEWVIEVGCISLINIENEDLIQLFLPFRIFNLVH